MVKLSPVALYGISLKQEAGNPMDKIVVVLSLVGVAVWLSHTAAKKRGKIHERFD
jgi:hypothetical protein